MDPRTYWRRIAQLLVVLLCALALKQYYSTANPNQLRFILAPTTTLVELVSGKTFAFESYSGYLSSDRTFLIAGSCAGVNFLITAFLLLSLRKLWRSQRRTVSWRFIPISASIAYLATLVANTVRISTALMLQRTPLEIGGISPNQLHRFEGIFIYFGFLLLLFVVSESKGSGDAIALEESVRQSYAKVFRQFLFPLLIYYTTTLAVPLANGAYLNRPDLGLGADFWQHSLFVLLTPLILILPLAALRFYLEPDHYRAERGAITLSDNIPVSTTIHEFTRTQPTRISLWVLGFVLVRVNSWIRSLSPWRPDSKVR